MRLPSAVLWPSLIALVLLLPAIVLGSQGALTQPIATVVAAVMVPTLGFVGFRYQKFLDREGEALAVRRNAYVELINAVHQYRKANARDADAHLWDYHKQAELVFLLGRDEVAEALSMHELTIRYLGKTDREDLEIYETMFDAEQSAFDRVLDAMRADLDAASAFVPSKSRAVTKPERRTRIETLELEKEQ